MIFRALSPSGDWTFGSGVQNYLRDEAAIEANVKTRVKSFFGDCFWATEFGIDWWNLLGNKSPAAQAAVLLALRLSIAESYGVVRINSVSATTDRATRRMTAAFNIDTIFSRSVAGSVQP